MQRIPILQMGKCLLVTIQVDLQDQTALALQDDLSAKIEATGRASLDGIGFRTDYFSVRDARSLLPATPDTGHFVVLVASRLGSGSLPQGLAG